MKSIFQGLMAIAVLLSVTVSRAHDKNEADVLQSVFERYFKVKDALVNSDGKTAASESARLLKAINAVKMESLTVSQHEAWMKVLSDMKEDAEHISQTNDPSHQRDHFVTLSENMYVLQKVSATAVPVYYQHCPMANNGKGANWLSLEKGIRNPYYGSKMLSCGKTMATIH